MSPWVALRVACILLLIMGLSGLGVGLTIGSAFLGGGVPTAGLGIPLGLIAYGATLTAAGVGILLGRRWGWLLGVGGIALGLAALLWILAITTWTDSVIGGGAILWAVTLGLLLRGAAVRAR